MKKIDLLIMYFCAALALCLMYAPQPIAPIFESELGISKAKAGLFITAIMLPLAFASIIYGYILEKISIKKLLTIAFFLLGGSEIVFGLTKSYFWMLNIRGFQGLLLPVVLTGVMSYISQTSSKDQVASAIGKYIGVTIIGGFLGRFLSGFFSDYFGWNFFIILLGILMILVSFLIYKFTSDVTASFTKPKLKDIVLVLKIPHNFHIYIMIFCAFFAFQAILNFIPFEIANLDNKFSGTKTAMMYIGYAFGVLISFNIKKIVGLFGSAQNSLIIGSTIFLIVLQIFHAESFWVLFWAMILFCIGNFIVHACASAFVNKMALDHKGIANGLYVSFYYAGGALGSFLPGFVYMNRGWSWFLLVNSIVITISILLLLHLKYAYQK